MSRESVNANIIDYRVQALKEVWQQDRALQGNLTITVDRVTISGYDAAAGIVGTTASATGFPVTLPVFFRNYTLREIGESHGYITEDDREIVIYDTSAENGTSEWIPRTTDIITSQGERWYIKSITRNVATKVLRLSVSPVPVVKAQQR